jgi:hypothetical protein
LLSRKDGTNPPISVEGVVEEPCSSSSYLAVLVSMEGATKEIFFEVGSKFAPTSTSSLSLKLLEADNGGFVVVVDSFETCLLEFDSDDFLMPPPPPMLMIPSSIESSSSSLSNDMFSRRSFPFAVLVSDENVSISSVPENYKSTNNNVHKNYK